MTGVQLFNMRSGGETVIIRRSGSLMWIVPIMSHSVCVPAERLTGGAAGGTRRIIGATAGRWPIQCAGI